MWDERYAQDGWAFGTEPNEFLVSVADLVPVGPVLSLGEGEGRNGVFLARRGHDVLGVDASRVGLAKAERLAREAGVRLRVEVADLASFAIAPGAWSGIVSIFCHLPADVRKRVHAAVARGLAPGGVFVLEAYGPRQLDYGTGGPKTPELLLSLDDVRRELAGLEWLRAEERVRPVREGRHHDGLAHVVQVVARRPSDGGGPAASEPSP